MRHRVRGPADGGRGRDIDDGYLGGAIASHVRVADTVNLVPPLVLGILAWVGLYLRDARVRALLPLRS